MKSVIPPSQPQIIVTGHVLVDAEDRDRYVDQMRDLVLRARRTEGCFDLSICVDSADPTRVNVCEVWATQEELDHWRENAHAPELDVEFRGGSMSEYLIERARAPFTE